MSLMHFLNLGIIPVLAGVILVAAGIRTLRNAYIYAQKRGNSKPLYKRRRRRGKILIGVGNVLLFIGVILWLSQATT